MWRAVWVIALSFSPLAFAEDYVFFHNNDSLTVSNTGGVASVQVCSISSKSAYEYTCNGSGSLLWINTSNQWTSKECPLSGNYATIQIVVREKGQHGGQGTVGPANSDMVVRVVAGQVTQVQGRDQKASVDKNKCK